MSAALRCTVGGCGEPLAREGRCWRCPRRHAFDIARSGYLNLLQAQQRRARRPGDSPEVVAARRRLFERGLSRALVAALNQRLPGVLGGENPGVLDIGCGEGGHLRALALPAPVERAGIDISVAAIEAAARALPSATWVVGNADRGLPWADASFAAALSINGRLPAAEMRRVLRPDGHLLVAVPGPDDLAELRQATLGEFRPIDAAARARAALEPTFRIEQQVTVRDRMTLDAAGIADLQLATYRGGRRSRLARSLELASLELTVAWELHWLLPAVG